MHIGRNLSFTNNKIAPYYKMQHDAFLFSDVNQGLKETSRSYLAPAH